MSHTCVGRALGLFAAGLLAACGARSSLGSLLELAAHSAAGGSTASAGRSSAGAGGVVGTGGLGIGGVGTAGVGTAGVGTAGVGTVGVSMGGSVGGAGAAGVGCAGAAGSPFAVCDGGARTTVSGIVRDPAGRVPLYNVLVYAPGATPPPIPEGASCDPCTNWTPDHVLSAALTDTYGSFQLEVPAGSGVRLMIQSGKWRRELALPTITACVNNPLEANLTRLPREQSEGRMPQIALTTSSADAVECFLRRVGVADSEFTPYSESGRVHVFAGCDDPLGLPAQSQRSAALGGGSFAPAAQLYGDSATLARYDELLLSDDCTANLELVDDYTRTGGRLLVGPAKYDWFLFNPSWQSVLSDDYPAQYGYAATASVDVSFPKGLALADWLLASGASSQHGQLPLREVSRAFHLQEPTAQRLLYAPYDPAHPEEVQSFNLSLPLDAAEYARCGRSSYVNFRPSIGQADILRAIPPFPGECADAPLTPEELMAEFLLFDQPSCVVADHLPPVPPGGCN